MKKNILIPEYNNKGIFLRKVRSFVRRQGRITRSQLNAIKQFWPSMGIDIQENRLNFSSIFDRPAPIVLEIGFGSGKSLVKTAISFPDINFLGIEVYKSGIGSCLRFAHISNIQNLKIIYHDANEVLNTMIDNDTLSTVQVFFPDPWNKKRHHKRRMLNRDFLQVISKKLKISGILHIITDSKEYAHYILENIKSIKNYKNISQLDHLTMYPFFNITTKFEKKACLHGNAIFRLIFRSN
ncbi:tRNA (guanosine(46)-N7)-methyltransferase TrmB [Buchnera aphidicola (Hyadaphis tataricae)]|uniref:tRNA (guanine-N(7)-)-methyltransferase n=1 Tax=Buchnera aphidicola (Hyadaphis tataricae) TaxID=1241859 RepID=A0A4D6Y642_9GAMM|nr:tRNA (guanosine(46)-N7)-methyltransferase TrmB [Buchnera aphidicola]QCI21824.1 tRNA (guanosine(46)-N7)-methyltransferase TrmB [Buchnera aphidicola (Hyadaphis tataricae)]